VRAKEAFGALANAGWVLIELISFRAVLKSIEILSIEVGG
jgi:hypothetical protein